MSSPARLLFLCRLNRAAASTRPGACAARTMPIIRTLKLSASIQTSSVFVSVLDRFLFAAQLRRSNTAAPGRSQDTTRYDIDCVNRASTFSLSVCLSVCQSRTALFRSTYTVQGPLCPNREPCEVGWGKHMSLPERKLPNVGTLS